MEKKRNNSGTKSTNDEERNRKLSKRDLWFETLDDDDLEAFTEWNKRRIANVEARSASKKKVPLRHPRSDIPAPTSPKKREHLRTYDENGTGRKQKQTPRAKETEVNSELQKMIKVRENNKGYHRRHYSTNKDALNRARVDQRAHMRLNDLEGYERMKETQRTWSNMSKQRRKLDLDKLNESTPRKPRNTTRVARKYS